MLHLNIDIPKDFLKEEIRCNYLINKKMKCIWAVQLDILNIFNKICKKYNIKYFAAYGTLLGTIRHEGFIPWDDDIDVCMLRSDYNKFCEIAPREFQYPYFFQTEQVDPGSFRPGHAQIRHSETTGILTHEINCKYKFNQGIFIDVFPFDGVIDNKVLFEEQQQNAKMYRHKTSFFIFWGKRFYVQNDSVKCGIEKIIHNIIGNQCQKIADYYDAKFNHELARYSHLNTEYVSELYWDFNGTKWYKEDFQENIYKKFEFIQIPVPIGFERILSMQYGNWQVFKIGTDHGGVFYDVNKSYKNYI